jgi:hypothetical protein
MGKLVPKGIESKYLKPDVLNSMLSSVLGDKDSFGKNADAIARAFKNSRNTDANKKAYGHVFEMIRAQEKGTMGPEWTPRMTGLVRTRAPPGKGPSVWVSPPAVAHFLKHGEDAIKSIGVEKCSAHVAS